MIYFFLNLESKDITNNADYTDARPKFLTSNCIYHSCWRGNALKYVSVNVLR